jgi:hypothetical protein
VGITEKDGKRTFNLRIDNAKFTCSYSGTGKITYIEQPMELKFDILMN